MGHRNADRTSIVMRRPAGETVGDMIRNRWEVTTQCATCRLEVKADLARIAQAKGAAFSLWNQDAPCRRIGCKGRVRFWAKAPGMTHAEPLICAESFEPPPPAWKRGRE
jgi:hypothetical protein